MRIKKVAVLGAGTMGSQIAAHFANASVPSLLFDMPGLAKAGIERLQKLEPAPLFDPTFSSLIEPLEFGKDFDRLKTADWIIEAVIEDLTVKRSLLQSILPHIREDAVVTSNTSGLPLSTIAAEMPTQFRRRWFGTHFFNPPRYLKLLELIPITDTDSGMVKNIADFADKFLGKGIVYAKDTPNFIANRLGTYSALQILKVMTEDGYTIEEVDALTGPMIGHPKTGTFRLFDLVGIDVLAYVAKNLYQNAPDDDEQREIFKLPSLIQEMLSRGWLGNKSGQGFYKKEGGQILVLDYNHMEYRPAQKVDLPSLELVRSMENPLQRINALIDSNDRAGTFLWKTTSGLLAYAANRIPEISDDILNVDQAMKWGFNWSHGPFELWDAIGLPKSVRRMREEGKKLPDWLDPLLAQPAPVFYKTPPRREGVLLLGPWKQEHGILKKNAAASLIDLGDGIACLEFHSKMNVIGADTMQMVRSALEIVEKDFEALVIGNQGENFSAGANLMLLLLEAQEGNWEDLNQTVKAFQQLAMSLRYSPKPAIAAPFGLALGGGCEISMAADAIHSASELYMGLAEAGVGLIPAGTGSKEIYLRNMKKMPPGADPLAYLRQAFETIALARISRSAPDAKRLGYLNDSDTFSMSTDRVLEDAKSKALQLAKTYRPSQPRNDILMTGKAGYAYLQTGIYLMKEASYISDYDAKIGEKIAWVLTGGDFTEPVRVNEQFLLDLEREAFLSLLGERKTQERIQHMLKTGKPLRN